jgi:hypothetical protein
LLLILTRKLGDPITLRSARNACSSHLFLSSGNPLANESSGWPTKLALSHFRFTTRHERWARLQTAHKNKLGFASPKLYRGSALLTSTTPLGFHDVIAGANGLYRATPGWDYTTGLGTPDVSLLNSLIH